MAYEHNVTSHNIAYITAQAARTPPPMSIPAPEALIDTLRRKLMREANRRNDPDKKIRKIAERAAHRLKKFEEILTDLPQGMELATVYYDRNSAKTTAAAGAEFKSKVRTEFLRYLAQHYADDLRKMGLCDYAIERMEIGLHPVDQNGQSYEVNIDHVIERSGAGSLSTEKAVDPVAAEFLGREDYSARIVNHFGNLVLMPLTVHEKTKNFINTMQELSDLEEGQGAWALMLVPKRDARNPYIFIPRADGTSRYPIEKAEKDARTQTRHLAETFNRLESRLNAFDRSHVMSELSSITASVAKGRNMDIADVLEKQRSTAANDNGVTLGQIFQATINAHGGKTLKRAYEQTPYLIREANKQAEAAFNAAARHYKVEGDDGPMRHLYNVLSSKSVRTVRRRLRSVADHKVGNMDNYFNVLEKTRTRIKQQYKF